jgi:hypothetical protein
MNKIKIERIESLLRCKTSEEKLKKLKFTEIVDIIRATTTFIKVINIIFKHDENITIADLKKNLKLLTNIYIDSYRLNRKLDVGRFDL